VLLPSSAYGFVYQTFNEITGIERRKLTFGLLVALWAASSASPIQDSMNTCTRSRSRGPTGGAGAALLIGTLLSLLLTSILAVLLATSVSRAIFCCTLLTACWRPGATDPRWAGWRRSVCSIWFSR